MIKRLKSKYSFGLMAGATIFVSVLAITGQGVLASLNATVFNTSAQNVNAGTLKLDLANAGNGFSSTVGNLAPGDVVNRYVTLTNSGSLDGIGLSVKTSQTGTQSLITDGSGSVTTKALKLTITSCSLPWNTANGACSGNLNTELPATVLGSLSSATFLANGQLNSSDLRYLQMRLELPNQNETTVNGLIPTNTIQGGSVNVTYTFDLAQRVASTSNN